MQSHSLISSCIVAGVTLFTVSKTAMGLYQFHAKKTKLANFIDLMKSYEGSHLENHCDSQFSQLINKEDPNFNDLNIEHIGGKNNRVYRLTHTANNQDLAVFRVVDNDHSLACYDRLIAHNLSRFVSTRHALIPASYTNRKRGVIGSFVEVSEYFSAGNLEDHIVKFNGSLKDRQDESIQYLIHTIEMLVELAKANVFFADLKTSNLFIKYDKTIALADLKSLVAIGPDDERKSFKKPLLLTITYLPPELISNGRMKSDVDFDLDALQSYQLGLCLYEILTGDFSFKLQRNAHDENMFIFDHPVFQSNKGYLLKNIICDLVDSNPKHRLTVRQICEKYSLTDLIENRKIDYHNHYYFHKKYQEMLSHTNQSRLDVSLSICKLKDIVVQNENGDMIYKKDKSLVPYAAMADYVNEIKKLILIHHQYKDGLKRLAFHYQGLSKEEKIAYWSTHVSIEESYQIVDSFDFLIQELFKKNENDYVFSDLFQALHIPAGRELFFKALQLLSKYGKTIKLVEGDKIQVNYSVANEADKRELSAKSTVNILIDENMSLHDFNNLLDMSMQNGNPEVITELMLQYPNSWSVAFGDTMNSRGAHDYYLIDSSVTLLHEIGHVIALLSGEFVVSQYHNFLPNNLQPYYHELEEYLNIEKRQHAESKIDPIEFKRIGHTGYEMSSIDQFTTEEVCDYLFNEQALANKEKMIEVYRQASLHNGTGNKLKI